MSLLGIDVGTTGCKAGVFAADGSLLASAYEEYDIRRPEPGWAELDSAEVWDKVRVTIRRAVRGAAGDPVQSLAVSSLGEAMAPVSAGRELLGPSLLNFDLRGAEYVDGFARKIDPLRLNRINGNKLGHQYSLFKLAWIRDHQPRLYEAADKFLLWGALVPYLLGAEPVSDYALANRTLFYDLDRRDWSDELLEAAGLDRGKLPGLAPAGTPIGTVSKAAAEDLGLPPGVIIAAGTHDQCASAAGCGAVADGQSLFGMGTYVCLAVTFSGRRDPAAMLERGLNTQDHAAPGRLTTFIYNQGGSLLKWYRDTFAAAEHGQARKEGRDVYASLLAEMPQGPSSVLALPHWSLTGPPEFVPDSSGVLVGLKLQTSRGEILKGLLEGVTYYLKECVESLPETGIEISDYRAAGGGSRSDLWIQLSADILERPIARPRVIEAGILGEAILAGMGAGIFPSIEAGVEAMVKIDRVFEPDIRSSRLHRKNFERYKKIWPLLKDYLRGLGRVAGP